jgi:hypothetical protein
MGAANSYMITPPRQPDPDSRLVEFVGEFLKHFGRGIRVRLRVAGAQCTLTFPEGGVNEAPRTDDGPADKRD